MALGITCQNRPLYGFRFEIVPYAHRRAIAVGFLGTVTASRWFRLVEGVAQRTDGGSDAVPSGGRA